MALDSAKAAVLLGSVDFLASKFIAEKEMPALLAAAEGEGAKILPVILRPGTFMDTKLSQVQSVNKPSEPVSGMPKVKREELWVKVARLVRDALKT